MSTHRQIYEFNWLSSRTRGAVDNSQNKARRKKKKQYQLGPFCYKWLKKYTKVQSGHSYRSRLSQAYLVWRVSVINLTKIFWKPHWTYQKILQWVIRDPWETDPALPVNWFILRTFPYLNVPLYISYSAHLDSELKHWEVSNSIWKG